MNSIWPWLLDAVGLSSLWLLTRKSRAGFAVGALAMFLWLAYAADTAQWGFVPGVIVYTLVHVKGYWGWGSDGDGHGATVNSGEL